MRKHKHIISFHLASIALMAMFLAAPANAALVLDQSNLVAENEGGFPLDGSSQTFTVGLGGVLSKINVQVSRYSAGATPFTATFSLKNMFNGAPGSTIFSTTVPSSNFPVASIFAPVPVTSIDVSSLGLVVRPGDVLAFGLSGGTGSTYWASTSPTYAGGSPFNTSNVTQNTFDYGFQTFVEPDTQTVAAGNPQAFHLLEGGSGELSIDLPTIANGGTFSANYGEATLNDLLNGDVPNLAPIDFVLPGSTFQYWNLDYTGVLQNGAKITFSYDEALLAPGTDESQLGIYHYENGHWALRNGMVNTTDNTITVDGITSFSPWGVGLAPAQNAAVPEPASLTLWGLGALGCVIAGYRRRRTSA